MNRLYITDYTLQIIKHIKDYNETMKQNIKDNKLTLLSPQFTSKISNDPSSSSLSSRGFFLTKTFIGFVGLDFLEGKAVSNAAISIKLEI